MADKEFITKLAARTAIENYACRDCVHSNGKKCEDCEYQDCINFINEVQAADVQPVKRGRWYHINNEGFIYCSECQNEAYWDTDYGQQLFDYCPYCGAKMLKP